MVLKKIDNRIPVLIDNGVKLGHRSIFLVVGKKARDQVPILHHMLAKAEVKTRPTVLWCYKKELGFSNHRKKRMKRLQQQMLTKTMVQKDDNNIFDSFITSTKIRYCYYSETHKIIGNTYGMCVLQDFEALTPNLMARTVETVEGGGLIVFLLTSVTSTTQVFTMSMDAHARYRTEAHQDIIPRFNERFLLSLASCKACLFISDKLDVLSTPLMSAAPIERVDNDQESMNDEELVDFKRQIDDKIAHSLADCCKTLDQGKAIIAFIDALQDKRLRTTVSVTAGRGRGKSAALGLAVAAAVAHGYTNIFVTSPSPENLTTFFEFVHKGLVALAYQEHIDYNRVNSTNVEHNKAVMTVEIFRYHRQIVQYINPADNQKLLLADLVVIDEAAAIPLPYIKSLLGPYLVFLASTVDGYEGTGRSLSLKLFQQLRVQTSALSDKNAKRDPKQRTLREITLEEPIRYKAGDDVEAWLTKLLCLNVTCPPIPEDGLVPPKTCKLYYINRDTLFARRKDTEEFLRQMVALCVASHYKNSPNDLQMMSDAPAHHLFCLMRPYNRLTKTKPFIYVIIEVALEGEISKQATLDSLSTSKRTSSDIIPWTISQQFLESDFARLAGARIVRIATHPECQRQGYATRALNLLRDYYEMKIPIKEDEIKTEITPATDDDVKLLKNGIKQNQTLPPLLTKLNQRQPESLIYLGVAFGLTEELLKFWKNSNFLPVYIKQTTSDITGEHSCIMLKALNDKGPDADDWLGDYWIEFRRRFVTLLQFEFKKMTVSLAYYLLHNAARIVKSQDVSKEELNMLRVKSARSYIIRRHLQTLAKLYFLKRMGGLELGLVESAILLGYALQNKTEKDLASELDVSMLGITSGLDEATKKIVKHLRPILNDDPTADVTSDEDQFSDQEEDQQNSSQVTESSTKQQRSKSKKRRKSKSKQTCSHSSSGNVGKKKKKATND